MIAKIQVYDDDINELLKDLDRIAREDDPAKYGLPPNQHKLNMFVYHWLDKKDKRLKNDTA